MADPCETACPDGVSVDRVVGIHGTINVAGQKVRVGRVHARKSCGPRRGDHVDRARRPGRYRRRTATEHDRRPPIPSQTPDQTDRHRLAGSADTRVRDKDHDHDQGRQRREDTEPSQYAPVPSVGQTHPGEAARGHVRASGRSTSWRPRSARRRPRRSPTNAQPLVGGVVPEHYRRDRSVVGARRFRFGHQGDLTNDMCPHRTARFGHDDPPRLPRRAASKPRRHAHARAGFPASRSARRAPQSRPLV